MRRAAFGLFGLLGIVGLLPQAGAAGPSDYSILIISRERLEVATSCEIGVYINDQLAGRLFQEQSTSFNLPAGELDVRLRYLPGQVPGCQPGIENQRSTHLKLAAGQINKYRIAVDQNGLTLIRAGLGY
ncbi:hypothetical protein N5D52_05260 [Pseudomonas sp. GD03860]|uniref:hypothetical protein n=1 Tax=Pseudomonas TaxID=286 RepID=UPI002363316E|nr:MULTISPECIES: hypothetical protein [Pseudomonas]MDD2060242.1 hypothetical protein [Pseudomonas putida]MDH0636338.1 hypothetical protein [Pseudomonas sp. GD03860]